MDLKNALRSVRNFVKWFLSDKHMYKNNQNYPGNIQKVATHKKTIKQSQVGGFNLFEKMLVKIGSFL